MTRSRLAILLLIVITAGATLGPTMMTRSQTAQANTVTRLGYYVTYDPGSWESLRANIEHLDIVSPYFYHLTPSGTIKEFDEPETTSFIQQHDVDVVPIIQNESRWDAFGETIGTPEKQEDIVELLVELVESKGYDGLQIDFEGVNATDAELLTEFMGRLSDAFDERDLILSQAIIPRVSDVPSTWGGAYEYEELAELTDFLVLMAYDHTPSGSDTPGAVAPLWWVDEVLHYATGKIPRSDIFLGVPFYGYDWNLEEGEGASSVTFRQAQELAARDDATGGFSPSDQSPWIRYTDDNDEKHEVWYENYYSLEAKLELVRDYELAGFGAWRLGQEDPDSWRLIANLETPATPVEGGPETDTRWYFEETGHWLEGIFFDYWINNGGLARFGLPRTEPFVEYDPLEDESYRVQYFERARFEHHPEFAGTQYEVLLGHLGRWAMQQRGLDPWATAVEPSTVEDARTYYPQTGHTLGGVFQEYWENNGGLSRFGYPISEEIVEVNPEDGQTYTVQYFERARFEFHPENSPEHRVLLGLLGNEMLRERGWIR